MPICIRSIVQIGLGAWLFHFLSILGRVLLLLVKHLGLWLELRCMLCMKYTLDCN